MNTNTYIIVQNVTTEDRQGDNINIGIDSIIRKVLATSEEEAIGKFINETRAIKNVRKLDPYCIPLDLLRTIN